jgi:hypothetical protein
MDEYDEEYEYGEYEPTDYTLLPFNSLSLKRPSPVAIEAKQPENKRGSMLKC